MTDNSSPDRSDLDALFADIVAHWDDEGTEPAGPATPGRPGVLGPTGPEPGGGPDTDERGTEERGTDAERTHGPEEQGTDAQRTHGPEPEGQLPPLTPVVRPEVGRDEPPAPADDLHLTWRSHTPPEEPEEHYVPPPPEPLPAGDLQFWGILIGLGGGPLLLLYLILFGRTLSGWWTMLAIGMTVGGFGLLVSRLPGRHDDGDDGARV